MSCPACTGPPCPEAEFTLHLLLLVDVRAKVPAWDGNQVGLDPPVTSTRQQLGADRCRSALPLQPLRPSVAR